MIRVLFFGYLGEKASNPEKLYVHNEDTDNLQRLFETIADEDESLGAAIREPQVAVAINRETVDRSAPHPIADGDEVAFLPPVTGG